MVLPIAIGILQIQVQVLLGSGAVAVQTLLALKISQDAFNELSFLLISQVH
jgi:hypothetical protein